MLALCRMVVIQAHLAVGFWILLDHILIPPRLHGMGIFGCVHVSLSALQPTWERPWAQSGSTVEGKFPAKLWGPGVAEVVRSPLLTRSRC